MEDEDVGCVAVRVGQGDIYDRISSHQRDDDIADVEDTTGADLFVTWAKVPESSRNGVEQYLANELDPLIGEQFPEDDPIPVKLPSP